MEDTTSKKDGKRMPVVFVGHGSPMIAIEDTPVTRGLSKAGKEIMEEFGKPKAILSVSAHWVTGGNHIQSAEHPRQIFDMYGFPDKLYQVEYEPEGCMALTDKVLSIKELSAEIDDTWGIDHGTWTPLVHLFPASLGIPVVQLSVNMTASPEDCYHFGELLSSLRDEGYLILGSGNIVHNLRLVNWDSNHGSPEAVSFDREITEAVLGRDDRKVLSWKTLKDSRYSVPTDEHFLPLLYCLGASKGEKARMFNHSLELDAISMTSFIIG